MLRGAEGDESLPRLRAAASSPAVRRTVPIPAVLIGRCRGKTRHKQAKSVGEVCHRHRVGGSRVTRLFALDLA